MWTLSDTAHGVRPLCCKTILVVVEASHAREQLRIAILKNYSCPLTLHEFADTINYWLTGCVAQILAE